MNFINNVRNNSENIETSNQHLSNDQMIKITETSDNSKPIQCDRSPYD